MLREALRAKSQELGREYSYRDLERDSGVNYSYVSKVVHGTRPSRAIVRAWSEALTPYFPLDAALVAAGHAPEDPRRANIMRHIAELPGKALAEIEDFIIRTHLKPPASEPPDQAADQADEDVPGEDDAGDDPVTGH